MPSYNVLIDGKPHQIEVAKTAERTFSVKADGKAISVELEAEKPNFEKQLSIKIEGKTYRLDMSQIDREKSFPIKVDEATFKAEVKSPTPVMALSNSQLHIPTPVRKPAAKNHAAEGAVTAPMTGKIMSLKVKKGEVVKQGQVLCIIEAMKMENEITAPKAGTLQEVNISEGSSVNEGETLFVIG